MMESPDFCEKSISLSNILFWKFVQSGGRLCLTYLIRNIKLYEHDLIQPNIITHIEFGVGGSE